MAEITRGGACVGPEFQAPIVVLLGLKMPKLNGLDVLCQLKMHPELRAIPVVMLTASHEERDPVASYHLSVNAYVVKPVNLRGFGEAIRGVGVFWGLINAPPPATRALGV